jgi:membrane carboxypeptidase/penicillin-binding protein PbpC
LLAAIDGRLHVTPRPTLPSTPSQPTLRRFVEPTLAITSPTDHSEFIIDSDAIADCQRIPLHAQSTGESSETLFWFIDGSPIGTANPDQPIWWQPIAGQHEIRVTNASGRSARATILVR